MIGLSPGRFYLSPPTSPRLVGLHEKINAGKSWDNADIAPNINDITSKEAAIIITEVAPKTRPVMTAEPTVSETSEEVADVEEKLVLETWKKALSLDGGRCGAINKRSEINERCENKITSKKSEEIDKLIEMLRRPNESPVQIETHLDNLAKIVHCYHHDHPPIRQTRMDEWLAGLPGPPRSPTTERRLRNTLGSAPINCIGLTKAGKPCGNNVGPTNRYFCEKTIGKMVQMATVPPGGNDDTLDYLVVVLRYHMLCYVHRKRTPTYQDEWTSATNKFQVACQHEMTRRESKNAEAEAKNTGRGKTLANRGGFTCAFRTPPTTPNSQVCKHPRDYWQEGLYTSPFNILGKNDMVEEGVTPNQRIRSVAEEPLNTGSDVSKSEVNRGYVYVFRVPGNGDFVKIGFTTKGDTRLEQWKKDCNREPTVIYPATKIVPHAHRVERLVHAELMEHRLRIYCERCGKQHNEWFEVSANVAISSVKKWSAWMEARPYEERVTRKRSEWYLNETEMKRQNDVAKFLQDLQEAVKSAEPERKPGSQRAQSS